MIQIKYTCDHCGAECSDKFELSLSGYAMDPGRFTTRCVHGCSRDHAILAVAKILGIGVDGSARELLEEQRAELKNTQFKLQKVENANKVNLAQIESLAKQRDEERGWVQLRAIEIDTWKKELGEARERIAELERACVAKDARTHEEMLARQNSQRDEAALREHIATLKASAVVAEEQCQAHVNELNRIREEFGVDFRDDIVRALKAQQAGHIDSLAKWLVEEAKIHTVEIDGERVTVVRYGDVGRAIDTGLASLTGPKKPTKPAVDHVSQACADCGGTGATLDGGECVKCRGKGYL